jgi:hypothetical protein
VKTEPSNLYEDTPPRWRVELFCDPRGNWFAAVERFAGSGYSRAYTATYTTPREALDAAYELQSPA